MVRLQASATKWRRVKTQKLLYNKRQAVFTARHELGFHLKQITFHSQTLRTFSSLSVPNIHLPSQFLPRHTLSHYSAPTSSTNATRTKVSSQQFWYVLPCSSTTLTNQKNTRHASYLAVSRSLNIGVQKLSKKSRSHIEILDVRRVTK